MVSQILKRMTTFGKTPTPSTASAKSTTTTTQAQSNAQSTQVKRKNALARFGDKLVSIVRSGVLNIRSVDTKSKSKIKDAKTKCLSKK